MIIEFNKKCSKNISSVQDIIYYQVNDSVEISNFYGFNYYIYDIGSILMMFDDLIFGLTRQVYFPMYSISRNRLI